MPASKFRGLVSAMYPFSDEERLCVCNIITTTYLLPRLLLLLNQERHGNCWVMRGAIFAFFALCLLLFLALLAGRHSDSTPDNYCCLFPLWCVPLNVPIHFRGHFSWTGNGQEWTWCCSRMDIRVCMVFSFSVFFVVVCTIFVYAIFPLGPWALVWPMAESFKVY